MTRPRIRPDEKRLREAPDLRSRRIIRFSRILFIAG